MIGESPGGPLPAGKAEWQIVIEKLNEELEEIPYAGGRVAPARATTETSNFEMVEHATPLAANIEMTRTSLN